ncbi:MAG: hypothetical protein OEV28_01170 [Nitrospirota bacterium]|nr:hypothetical protein [Nitrospirota bacterium]
MLRKPVTLLLVLGCLYLSGCATAERSFLLDLSYTPRTDTAEKGIDVPVVALNRLSDSRAVQDKTQIGDGINSAAKKDSFYLHGERIEILLTDALEDRLRETGFGVKRIFGWDRKPETADPAWGDITMGGEILDFWLDTDSSAFRYTAKARAKLRITAVNASTREVITSTIVEKSTEQSGGFMKKELLENLMTDIYTGLVSQILDDEGLRGKLKDLGKH